MFALLGALVSSFYLVHFKSQVRDESRIDMQLMFGFLGLCNFTFMWPVGVLLHLLHIETMALPEGKEVLAVLTGVSNLLCSSMRDESLTLTTFSRWLSPSWATCSISSL